MAKNDVRNDPDNKQTFKVMINNFKDWVIEIRGEYYKILNRFLNSKSTVSAIVVFASVKPMIEEVALKSDMML